MDLVLIELILWAGLLFFFWALKDGLSHDESEIETIGVFNTRPTTQTAMHFAQPESVAEVIGSYYDAQIYRYACINGRTYQFDRICPIDSGMALDVEERLVAPGLVYQECSDRIQPPGNAF